MSEHLKIWTKLAERLTEYFGEEVIRTVDHPVQTMGGKFSFAEPKVHPVSGDPYEVEVSGDLTFRDWTFKYYHPFNPNNMAWINMRATDVSEEEASDIAFLIMTKPMALRYKYISCIYNRYLGFDYQRTLKAIEKSSSFKIKWDPHKFCYEKVKPNIAKLALKIAEYEHVSISEDSFDPLSLDVFSYLPVEADGNFEDPVGLNIKTEWASFFPEDTLFTEDPIVRFNSREYHMEFRAEETYTTVKKYGSLPETDDIRILAAYFRYLMDTDHGKLTYIVKRIYDEGHAVGNHTWSHDYDNLYSSPSNFIAELERFDEKILTIIGVRPFITRAPGGSMGQFDESYSEALKEKGYIEHDWNVSSADAAPNDPVAKDFIDNIDYQTADGRKCAIILMHSSAGHEETVKALPEIIRILKERGYSFGVVTPMTPDL